MGIVHVKFQDTELFDKSTVSSSKMVHEYNTAKQQLQAVDVAYTKVKGAYPSGDKRYAANDVCTMNYYILSGTATLVTELGASYSLEPRDVLQLPPKTWYRIEGEFEALMVCSPAWYKEQSLSKA